MGKLSALKEGLEKAAKAIDDIAFMQTKNMVVNADPILKESQRFSEYNRLSNLSFSGPSWERLRANNKALRNIKSPDEEITIYRATIGDKIRPDDFVAVDKSIAEMELQNVLERDGRAKIIEQKIKASDLLMGNDSTEFVYFPKALDMSQAARMQRAAEQGFDYVRATAGDSPIAGMPWTMYKKANGDIDTVAQRLSRTYGENVWLAKADDAVDAKEIQRDIIKALRKHNIHEDYGVTASSLAREATPADIVDSAGLWDNPDLVQIVWDEVLEPKGIMAVKTPDGLIRFDEAPARSINAAFDPAQKASSNLLASLAPAAVGTGLAALGLNPQETQAAINNYIQATQGSNPILENLNRNLQQFGMNERGQMQTGTMQATPHPLLGQVADVVRTPQAPGIGPLFGGTADYLDKLAQGQEVTYGDRLGASLDIIP